MRISNRGLLPGDESDIASIGKLFELLIQLLNLAAHRPGMLVHTSEVEVADNMPLIGIPVIDRLLDQLCDVVLKRKPIHFLRLERALVQSNVLVTCVLLRSGVGIS